MTTNAVIWKYQLTPSPGTAEVAIEMPAGAMVLTVQTQAGQPCLWALVNEEQPLITRRFVIVGTGHPVPDGIGDYIGTWQNSPFVFHLFDAEWAPF